jgi:RNA polymerase subunit RPABC4/transcription elongation factor Spt4
MKTKECPACAMEVDADAEACPICGYEFPRQSWTVWVMVWVMIALLIWWLVF